MPKNRFRMPTPPNSYVWRLVQLQYPGLTGDCAQHHSTKQPEGVMSYSNLLLVTPNDYSATFFLYYIKNITTKMNL